MKTFIKHTLLLAITVLMSAALFTSCDDKKDLPNGGDPVIHYVRVTDPEKSDSLLDGAFMGSLIAIVGDNLGDVKEVWFNDQQATLNPSYITGITIILNVPSSVPSEVNNLLTMIFSNEAKLEYPFSVNIPGPQLKSIKSEYVEDGDVAVFYGDYFFEPVVVFPGELEAENFLVEKTKLEVIVPEGATSGPITITTNFGTVTSSFLFRDNRNTIVDFDEFVHENWTSPIAYADSMPDPDPCSGNYTYFKNDAFGAWMWLNEMTMQYWALRSPKGPIPIAEGHPTQLDFRFELNVPVEWVAVTMRIFFAPAVEDTWHDNATHCWWEPWAEGPYTTDGWETISIPLTEFNKNKDGGAKELGDISQYTNVIMMLFGPSDAENPVYMCIDNVRIVPNN